MLEKVGIKVTFYHLNIRKNTLDWRDKTNCKMFTITNRLESIDAFNFWFDVLFWNIH